MITLKERLTKLRDLIITNEPIDLSDIPHEVDIKVYDMIFTRPDKAIGLLLGYLEKFSDHPILLNWLICAYQLDDQPEKSLPLIKKNYDKNPTYLFARINYGMHELKENNNHKVVPTIFNDILWLPDLYPERKLFHITEVESFYHLVALYYIKDDQLENAQAMIDLLETCGSSPKLVGGLESFLNLKRGFAHFQKFLQKRKG